MFFSKVSFSQVLLTYSLYLGSWYALRSSIIFRVVVVVLHWNTLKSYFSSLFIVGVSFCRFTNWLDWLYWVQSIFIAYIHIVSASLFTPLRNRKNSLLLNICIVLYLINLRQHQLYNSQGKKKQNIPDLIHGINFPHSHIICAEKYWNRTKMTLNNFPKKIFDCQLLSSTFIIYHLVTALSSQLEVITSSWFSKHFAIYLLYLCQYKTSICEIWAYAIELYILIS